MVFFLADTHLELIVRPIAFVQVIEDRSKKSPLLQDDNYPLETIERINWSRAIINWQKKEFLQSWEPQVFYEPLLFGLSTRSLRNKSFLSAASFQETSCMLTSSAVKGRLDCLLGLKEHIILGTSLPIGTGSRFLDLSLSSVTSFSNPALITSHIYLLKNSEIINTQNNILLFDRLCEYEDKPLFCGTSLFLKYQHS
jgi:hypothetical protein